jgi:hypothetical protein
LDFVNRLLVDIPERSALSLSIQSVVVLMVCLSGYLKQAEKNYRLSMVQGVLQCKDVVARNENFQLGKLGEYYRCVTAFC